MLWFPSPDVALTWTGTTLSSACHRRFAERKPPVGGPRRYYPGLHAIVARRIKVYRLVELCFSSLSVWYLRRGTYFAHCHLYVADSYSVQLIVPHFFRIFVEVAFICKFILLKITDRS